MSCSQGRGGAMPPPKHPAHHRVEAADHYNPPPSSIALVVESYSRNNDGLENLPGRDVFQQLLQELFAEHGDEAQDATDDVAQNHILIPIITAAGLNILLEDDPFSLPKLTEDLLKQATNSLKVIQITIKRTPEVLFCAPPAQNSQSEQLFLGLWLLPRLFSLLSHQPAQSLTSCILDTIVAIFTAAAKSPSYTPYLNTILAYCHECFSGIIVGFQSKELVQLFYTKKFELELPAESFTLGPPIWNGTTPFDDQSISVKIRNYESAATFAVQILALFCRIASLRLNPPLKKAVDMLPTIQQGISELWGTMVIWDSVANLCEKTNSIRLKVLAELDIALDMIPLTAGAQVDGLYLLAGRCIFDTFQRPIAELSHPCERALAGILLSLLEVSERTPLVNEQLGEHLYPFVYNILTDNHNWKVLIHDLQVAMLQLCLTMAPPEDEVCCLSLLKVQEAFNLDGGFECKDEQLKKKLQFLKTLHPVEKDGTSATEGDGKGRRKRRKIEPFAEYLSVNQRSLINELYKKLGNQESSDLTSLSQVAMDGFRKLAADDQIWALETMGSLACAFGGTLHEEHTWDGIEYDCDYCDSPNPSVVNFRSDESQYPELLKTLEAIQGMVEFKEADAQVRCVGMRTFGRLLNHSKDQSYQDLGKSTLATWCIICLESSRRQLRNAASYLLPAFVRPYLEPEMLERNWTFLINMLKKRPSNPSHIEAHICAWGKIGRYAIGKELNLVLIQMVAFLGESSSFLVGVALCELNEIARAHRLSPRRLFTPFWPNISVSVAKQLISKPQVAANLVEFVSWNVKDFLKATQCYTLPYMILWKENDIVARIAQAASKTGVPVQVVCHENMRYILALLLVQDTKNVEATARALLANVCDYYEKFDMGNLVRPDAIPIAAELCKLSADANPDLKKRIESALALVAKLCHKKTHPRMKVADHLNNFFEMNILGLVTQFSDNLKEPTMKVSLQEKTRCLKAMKEMLILARGTVSTALPQICACLQSALEVDELRTVAIDAWSALVAALEPNDLGTILGQTFSLTVQYWLCFTEAGQKIALAMIKRLFTEKRSLLKGNADNIPELDINHPEIRTYEKKLATWRHTTDVPEWLNQLALRCSHENAAVVVLALEELREYLRRHEEFIHNEATNEKPHPVVPMLIRRLLDVTMAFKGTDDEDTKSRIERLCAECLGLIGAVDPDLVEARREKKEMVVLHNFARADESCEFVMFFLERIVVKAFLSATDTKAQGFLAWAAQELLSFCDIQVSELGRKSYLEIARKTQQDRWGRLSITAKDTLAPFLSSRYRLQDMAIPPPPSYPIFGPKISFREWIVTFLNDMLSRAQENNSQIIFSTCMRICKGQDISISKFLFPYVVVYSIICGTRRDRENIKSEFLAVLKHKGDLDNAAQQETIRNCCEAIFSAIDYCIRWLREKKEYNNIVRTRQARNQNRRLDDDIPDIKDLEVEAVSKVVNAVPADLMGERSLQFKSYARALQYWETHIRNKKAKSTEAEMEPLYEQLQRIYSYIDEPDGIEGISSKISNLDLEQQVLEHRKAGRWSAVQTWYELLLAEQPDNLEVQTNLATALRDSGQNESLLNQIDVMMNNSPHSRLNLLPYAVEASWIAGNWKSLEKYLSVADAQENPVRGYDISLGRALHALQVQDMEEVYDHLATAREEIMGMMTETATGSVRQCHDLLVKLHGLTELQEIAETLGRGAGRPETVLKNYMQNRLDVMGSYSKDKQYILALRRAVFMFSGKQNDLKENLVMAWLGTAQLARKANQPKLAFNAIHHATRLSGPMALIEHSKLLWQQGQTKNAIRNLEGGIEKKILEFDSEDTSMADSRDSNSSINLTSTIAGEGRERVRPQNKMVAKARLLLAKWIDRSGRTTAAQILENYTEASAWYNRWEQGFYYIGRHYNQRYEEEKSKLSQSQQTQPYLYGQMAMKVCQNYIRALAFGTKYIFLTVPRMLTLWMDLGDMVSAPDDLRRSHGSSAYVSALKKHREKSLSEIHKSQSRYFPRLAPWMFFIAFPQIMSRITHPNKDVFENLQMIITKVLTAYPQQAVWSLACVLKSTHKDRASRGQAVVRKLQVAPLAKKVSSSGTKSDINIQILIRQSNKLTEQLLNLSNTEVGKHVFRASISKDLRFNHNCAPCDLVLPTQATLAISMPSAGSSNRSQHNPFAPQQPTVQQFMDECEIMSSLQKPRKITIRGSDGILYHFLCKPKDDLRKDARLMEFNSMITRFLKKDPDTRKRSLYIRTYCVTPLNEECGLIEWVNNVRTLRDIILKAYKVRQVTVQKYTILAEELDALCAKPGGVKEFTDVILPQYPCVFYEWFLVMFSEPSAWFEARLRYTRTYAVMCMVGTILGLGDRHGENILFDTKNGDTLHVDFNCLFDKGLSFERPERVPFRLTQNIVDAFGSAGYEGVFRKACEGAMRLLRHNEETMMTVLEAFLHDPSVDMIGKKKGSGKGAPETPKEILEMISKRLRGLWEGGMVPLSVEGQVDNLIRKAVDPENLARMYVGWSPMF